MNLNTTHTVRYEAPGLLSSLTVNKVAQFIAGCLVIIVAFKACMAGWFSADIIPFLGIDTGDPEEQGFGNPIGLLPFMIDGVCFIGILAFAVIKLIGGVVGPLFGDLTEWLSNLQAEKSAKAASEAIAEGVASVQAISTGLKRASGQELSSKEAFLYLNKRIDHLAEITKHLEPPKPKTDKELLEEQAAELAELKKLLKEKSATPAKTGTQA